METKKSLKIFTHLTALIKNRAGFTIIEVISTIFIAIVILTILLISYVSYNSLFALETGIADIQNANLFAMNKVTTEVKNAKVIVATKTINLESFTTNTTTLVLEYPVFDSNNELVSGINEYGAFSINAMNDKQLRFVFEAHASSKRTDQDKIIGNYIDNIIFRFNTPLATDASSVSIFIKTNATTTSNADAAFIQSHTASLRNE